MSNYKFICKCEFSSKKGNKCYVVSAYNQRQNRVTQFFVTEVQYVLLKGKKFGEDIKVKLDYDDFGRPCEKIDI